jgi:predicted transcriptional regulator
MNYHHMKESASFVYFCEAMVNAPKELWHEVLVIIDEAHIFAPEKGESEALGSVTDLATRGRKRGYCAVIATQRLSKLNKDVAAECNNKLIGRASQDIDRKRAGEELGFTSKDEVLSLRNLEPGEFYVFGPAIGRDVEKIEIGDVSVKPAKRGVSKAKPPAPSSVVKRILSQLKDLPQEAQKEAQTIQELHRELRTAKAEILKLERQPKCDGHPGQIEAAVMQAEARKDAAFAKFKAEIYKELLRSHGSIGKLLELVGHVQGRGTPLRESHAHATLPTVIKRTVPMQAESLPSLDRGIPLLTSKMKDIPADNVANMPGAGEMKVLAAIASYEEGMTREHITIVTGYKRSTRDAYIQRLLQKGLVEVGEMIKATETGFFLLGPNFQPLPSGPDLADHYLRTLPEGESKILRLLLDTTAPLTRDQISEETGFKRSTRDAYIQRLRVRQLINLRGEGMVKASDHLQF